MEPNEIVQFLIETEEAPPARLLFESSVHLPARGGKWVVSFRDETGRQVWRTSGTRKRSAALALGQRWEQEAKRKRAAQGAAPRKPTIRVRPGSPEHEAGLFSQAEVAAILKISERTVREDERRAFDKLRRHPGLRDFWRQWLVGEVEEAASQALANWVLSRAEIATVYALAKTPVERRALRKLLALTGCGRVSTRASGTDAEST